MVEHSPSCSAPIGRRYTKVRKLAKNDYETISVIFFSGQNCGPKMDKFSSFFLRLENNDSENINDLGNYFL